ncbi:serine hydrolase [Armatimonas rosea]|uniref:CubicO group peptidase (Beta-lactamase class C family) n=1 Tax=Armatimonas rosea TaxID=685828 RepID=A0A7W9SPN5_ARMRO|nr:serine hydrolase [Armatimonas rosea]MBB6050557.1 CubicO group peptidase (beta-lactamase class C family) [Armatimonas rosea]
MKRYFLASLFALTLPALASAQTPSEFAALEKQVEAARVKYKIPGLSLGVLRDGKLVYTHGFGLRDVAKKLPATPETLYCIGSSTKAFTATAVLMAVDAGKVKLSERPVTYLPYFKLRDPETNAKLTVSDLLCHSSGLPRTDFLMLAGEGTLSRKELIQAVGAAKPTAKLGEKFQYQNLMFAAAGEVAATAFGMPYEKVIEQKIFAPLGMTRSTLSVAKALADKDHATGYDPASQKPLPWRDITATAPAGAINSSVVDMAKWVEALLSEAKPLLSPESYAAMTQKHISMSPTVDYGYGWFLDKWKGASVVEHGGNIDGFNAEVAFVPEKKWGLVMLSNVSQSPMAREIQELVWRSLSGEKPQEEKPAAEPSKPATPPTVPSKDEAGSYTSTTPSVTFKVGFEKDHLVLTVPGQPPYAMQHVTGRVYRLTPPLPETFKATFDEKGLTWEQPGVKLVLARVKENTYVAPLTVDALLEKMLTAAGGRAAWSKHKSRVDTVAVDFENQGMQAAGEAYAAQGRQAQRLSILAVGKKIGTLSAGYDGKGPWISASFLPPQEIPPSERARAEADLSLGLLEPRKLFATIELTGTEKVGGEECYVLLKTTKSGERLTEYVSTKSFLILRRDTEGPELYSDFRPSGGVIVPHKTVQKNPSMGDIAITIKSTRWDVPIDPKVFNKPK